MIFKRRERRPLWDRIRDLVSPRKGWRRGFKYIGRRVQRLPDTPHRIALGVACGALASFTPFFTLHALVAVLFAWIVRGNLLAAAFGTFLGNPITFPFIAASSLQIGNWLMGRSDGVETLEQLSFSYVFDHPGDFFLSIFTPYLLGGLGPGLLAAGVCYFVCRPIVASFQARRRGLLSRRARDLVRARSRRLARRKEAAARREDGGDPGAEAAETASERSPKERASSGLSASGRAVAERVPLLAPRPPLKGQSA